MSRTDEPSSLASLVQVLETLAPRLRALLGRYQIQAMDAEDVVQDALLSMIRNWDLIDNKERWLLVTLKNCCIQHHRHRKRWSRLIETVNPEDLSFIDAALDSCPQTAADANHDIRCVRRASGGLSDIERLLFTLKYAEGLGPAKIASIIGCHPGNVRKLNLRAISRLRVALGLSHEIGPGRREQ